MHLPIDNMSNHGIIMVAYATTRENGVYYDKVEHLGALPQSYFATGVSTFIWEKEMTALEKQHYTLGLDIGVASIGWAVLGNDECGTPNRIIDLGVRIFESAEAPKTGESLAAPRRDARSARRRLRRHRHRLERIRFLMVDQGLLSQAEMDHLYDKHIDKSPYQLRAEGLDRVLSNEEFARVLIHLAQRRGFQSTSTAEEEANAKENGVIKLAIAENQHRMERGGYRTLGEMMYRDEAFWENVNGICHHITRNKAGSYKFTVDRASVLHEIHLIFEAQRNLGSAWASQQMEDAYTNIVASQRNFDDGPGGNSPFRKGIDSRVGTCTLEGSTERRASKASFTFEYFKLLQDLNHMRLVSNNGSIPLTQDQRNSLEKAAFQTANLTYSQIRKKLFMPDDTRFGGLFYGELTLEEAEKRKWPQMQSYHKIRLALDKVRKGAITFLSHTQLDSIGEILSLYKSDEQRLEHLQAADIPAEYHQALLPLSFSAFGKLSIRAMQKLIPYLQQGMRYDEACRIVYGDHRAHTGEQRKLRLSLNDIDEITNPVVRRAVSQTIKVVNAVVRTYGEPDTVRIELAREMSHSFQERDKMKKRQEDNRKANQRVLEQIQETKPGDRVTGLDIVKFKLFQQQDGICLYSGRHLDLNRLYEPGYVDVDHIIPYSRCFDDSYVNKVLVLSSENREKGNRTPYEYFGQDETRWHEFSVRTTNLIRDFKKRQKLLNTSFSDARSKEFIQRNLNDTQYITRVVYNMLRDNLSFADSVYSDKIGKGYAPVQAVNGAITAMLRGRWGIQKERGNGDLHHCIDAVVIAATSPSLIQRLSAYYKEKEQRFAGKNYAVDPSTGEMLTHREYEKQFAPEFPTPWQRFREELNARLNPIAPADAIAQLQLSTYASDEEIKPVFVSHMPNRTVTGAAHKETIRSGIVPDLTITKTALTDLKLENGQIKGYYQPETDPLLYNALLARLQQYGGDGKKAFAEPFFKPKRDGTPGPRVDKVKICEKSTLNTPTGRGVADNGRMVRIDVYLVPDDGYYFIPLYVADTKKKALPDKAVIAYKSAADWKPMDGRHFLFSLFRDDLIWINCRKPITLSLSKDASGEKTITTKSGFFYYGGASISTASIGIETHDRRYGKGSLGVKTLISIEKYQVDVLGNISKVRLPEKRMDFKRMR